MKPGSDAGLRLFLQSHRRTVSRGRRSNPELTYATALRRFFCDGDAPRHGASDVGRFLGGDGDGNQKAKATAEERLYKTRIIISTE